jgi:hypothetical protein
VDLELSLLKRAVGKVIEITAQRASAHELAVDVDGTRVRSMAYPALVGTVEPGDEVVLNTTAVELSLGTGGWHFVIENLSRPSHDISGPGHIMKLRYTPHQVSVLSVEEDDSPYRQAIEAFRSLNRMPVLIGQLHSQIGPAAAAVKHYTDRRARVAYVMTDSAALPIGFSRLVEELKRQGFIDSTITCGQAFGGDYEAVTVYSGLIAALEVVRADVAIVCQGPGNVGTGTAYGFSGIEMGEIVNAVNILGGAAIAIPRISFADSRSRHAGLSHHTITALSQVALTPALVVLPMIDQMRLLMLQEQLARTSISYRHQTRIFDGRAGIAALDAAGIKMFSMGRSFNDDPEFFLAAAAAGAAAADMLKTVAF